ncbi:hypothetical protein [Streptomyces sp. HUAS TT7]|uniref:hypothetical protein n=1 Tax=Streptomyces sp. HUAS TT7 TaxID=3447507 RepID=UPI003F65E97A
MTTARAFYVMSAHGGSGASTVTHWLDPDGSSGTMEPGPDSRLPLNYTPLVVARSTGFGLQQAVRLIGRWHPEVPRPFLVIVQDAPLRLPKPVVYRLTAIRPRVLGVVHVPYLVRLREADSPADGLAHRDVQKAASRLRRDLGLPA